MQVLIYVPIKNCLKKQHQYEAIVETTALRLEAIPIGLEAIVLRLEAIALWLDAISFRLEAI